MVTDKFCNSNFFNDFESFFESKIENCVLYGESCEAKMFLARNENP